MYDHFLLLTENTKIETNIFYLKKHKKSIMNIFINKLIKKSTKKVFPFIVKLQNNKQILLHLLHFIITAKADTLIIQNIKILLSK